MARSSQILQLRDCVVDLKTRQVSRSDGVMKLTGREVEVLRYLAARPGGLVTRFELEREVWKLGPSVRSEAVAIAMRRLRNKLEIDPKRAGSLHIVHGEGWLLELHNDRFAFPAEPFFGREEELSRIAEALSGGARLLTLRGPGGSGKTRIAHRFAADHPGDHCFVDLTECAARDGAVTAILKALGADLQDTGEASEQLAQMLANLGRPLLLILDNLEHLAEALARSIANWLQSSSAIQILVTSRAPLGLAEERILHIGSLDPTAARGLFLERARRRAPDFAPNDAEKPVFERLLERLDYLPLALELTAARLGLFSLEEICERLDGYLQVTAQGRAGRHASIQATIACSWEMLSPDEQRALCRASVFRGGFTVEAAEYVLEVGNASELLNSLLDKSLLRVTRDSGRTRIRLYEAVRAFANRRLTDTDEVMARHQEAMATLGEALRQEGFRFGRGTRRLDSEEQNLLLALQTAKARGDQTAIARLSLILVQLYTACGPRALRVSVIEAVSTEGLDRDLTIEVVTQQGAAWLTGPRAAKGAAFLERACAMAESCEDKEIAGRTWIATCLHLIQADDYEGARTILRRIIDDPERSEMDVQVGIALGFTGMADLRETRIDGAESNLSRAITILEAAGHQERLGWACLVLAAVRATTGRLEASLQLNHRALAAHRELGHRRLEHYALCNIASNLCRQGKHIEAREFFEEALEGNRRMGSLAAEAGTAGNLAELLREAGELERAEQLTRRVLKLAHTLGEQRLMGIALGNLALVLRDRGQLNEAIPMLRDAIERCVDRDTLSAAHFSYILAAAMADQDELEEAQRRFDYGASIAEVALNPQTQCVGVLARAHILLARSRQAQSAQERERLERQARGLLQGPLMQTELGASTDLRLGIRNFEEVAGR